MINIDTNMVFYRANRLADGVHQFGTILPANSHLKKPFRIVDCFEEAEYEIDPDSISQCVGKIDTRDDLIFENDIIHVKYETGITMIVLWVPKELGFRAVNIDAPNGYINFYDYEVSVIAPIDIYYGKIWKEKKKEFLKEVQ